MAKKEMFRKNGARYETAPFYSCNDPHKVYIALAEELATKYLLHDELTPRVVRRRCPYCDFLDEIIFFYRSPNGDNIKTVYTINHL
jgi:hypothetical protein